MPALGNSLKVSILCSDVPKKQPIFEGSCPLHFLNQNCALWVFDNLPGLISRECLFLSSAIMHNRLFLPNLPQGRDGKPRVPYRG